MELNKIRIKAQALLNYSSNSYLSTNLELFDRNEIDDQCWVYRLIDWLFGTFYKYSVAEAIVNFIDSNFNQLSQFLNNDELRLLSKKIIAIDTRFCKTEKFDDSASLMQVASKINHYLFSLNKTTSSLLTSPPTKLNSQDYDLPKLLNYAKKLLLITDKAEFEKSLPGFIEAYSFFPSNILFGKYYVRTFGIPVLVQAIFRQPIEQRGDLFNQFLNYENRVKGSIDKACQKKKQFNTTLFGQMDVLNPAFVEEAKKLFPGQSEYSLIIKQMFGGKIPPFTSPQIAGGLIDAAPIKKRPTKIRFDNEHEPSVETLYRSSASMLAPWPKNLTTIKNQNHSLSNRSMTQ